MELKLTHPWVKTVAQAKIIQEQLRSQVITSDCLGNVDYVAGVDIGFKNNYTISQAAIALRAPAKLIAILTYPTLELVEHKIAQIPTAFPYVPGYLSFREIPDILAVLPQLEIVPNLILCDGEQYPTLNTKAKVCRMSGLAFTSSRFSSSSSFRSSVSPGIITRYSNYWCGKIAIYWQT